jgi:TPR repeat protein
MGFEYIQVPEAGIIGAEKGTEWLKKAMDYFQKAADQGEDNAQYSLGVMYANGEGVPKDYRKAVEWYQKAAEQGNVYAQHSLGGMYLNGYGVIRDHQKGCSMIHSAAEQGFNLAIDNYKKFCSK